MKPISQLSFRTFLFILSASGLFAVGTAQAEEMPGWWVEVEAGAAFNVDENRTTTEPMPGVSAPDDYVSTSVETAGILGVGAGYGFEVLEEEWLPLNQVGVYYDYYFPATIDGHVNKYQTTETYKYTMKNASNTLWLSDRLYVYEWEWLMPFIEGAIGIAWNRLSDYEEHALSSVPGQDVRALSADFATHTKTDFAWRVGAGVTAVLPWCNERLGVSALWRYSDRGIARTGSSANYETMDKGIETSLRSNEVLGSVSYRF